MIIIIFQCKVPGFFYFYNFAAGCLNKRRKRKVKLKVAANGVAQRKLHLVKTPLKNNLPRHPMPFASKNLYYDERWFIKQEEGIRLKYYLIISHKFCQSSRLTLF